MLELTDESERVASLLEAQSNAAELFDAVEAAGLIQPGRLESQVSDSIRDLAADLLGVTRHWHKRVIRAGVNTLEPYRMNPPDRVIAEDDIVFVDFGPIFAEWEADFGRTYVLGTDPVKQRLRDDLRPAFDAGRACFEATPDITGAQLFDFMVEQARQRGWEWGGTIAGHVVGEFPHTEFEGEHLRSLVAPGSTLPMRGVDTAGRVAHWILEVHFVDRDRQIGGFYEQLLDL